MSDIRNLIIIGSGPAGYTAAVYAARANLNPLVIEGAQSGGALMTTTEVENFPGFPDGILGPELMDNMRKQAERFGAEFITDDASGVALDGPVKRVWIGNAEYQARAVILATGSAWRPLGVPGEQELLGHGVSSCATCDGFFFRGQHVAVVGGGDSAMEEATFLTRFARVGHHRAPAGRVPGQQDHGGARADQPEDHGTVEHRGHRGAGQGRQGRRGRPCATPPRGRSRPWTSRACSWRSGTTRAASSSGDRYELDENGYVVVEAPSTRTSVAGVFAAGDLVDHTYRQAITAAGTGCAAALDAERYIAGLES